MTGTSSGIVISISMAAPYATSVQIQLCHWRVTVARDGPQVCQGGVICASGSV
jgi:hypothetical protein